MAINSDVLFSFDREKVKGNAKKLLKSYRKIARKVGFVTINCKTRNVAYFDRKDVDFTNAENREFLEMRNAMIDALLMLCDKHMTILYYTYFSLNKWTGEQIGSEIGYSRSHIETLKPIAIVEFAEAYQRENLLIGECAE